ncbi:DUF3887 domain-containing protein (plasmid) [Curtobacterium sp. TC1]|uniref:DUF3887 domain-containing protein n=1 Tax=Curtobacterium sp. TC1 TaxID=2862880 RepID=UPI001C9A44A4|nr:DUF3887 domain-containing protein [Curtobacterium sp. TC1]QZQ53602.1 DUF3887 domain-containing protein [Curtobacterium sp. TC1]
MSDRLRDAAAALHQQVGAILAAPVLASDNDVLLLLRSATIAQTQATTLVAAVVESARAEGRTWQEIGEVLGVSRQAAFQRFGRPIDPRTGEAMLMEPFAEAGELARTVIDELVRADWDDVVARFDPSVRARLGPDGLAAAWAQVIATVGAFESRGEPEVTRAADLTVTNTTLAFEAGEFVARISFRDDGMIGGLFILPPGTA